MSELDWGRQAVPDVVGRLGAAGLALSPAFVSDVLEKYRELVSRHPGLGAPEARHELVRRIAASLYEEPDVILRVVEEIEREPALLLWSRPPAAAPPTARPRCVRGSRRPGTSGPWRTSSSGSAPAD